MADFETNSRSKRHEKQRKQKKKIMFFAGLGVLFGIILFSLIAFGNNENQEAETPNKSQAELALEKQEESYEISNHKQGDEAEKTDNEKPKDAEKDKDKEDKKEAEKAVDVKEVDEADPNVLKAYEGDWKPVGTTQTGEHTTNYDDGSADRKEIRKAVSDVTGINEQHMIEHWIGNGGDQKVEATVSGQEQEEFFRVYLTWVKDEGWKVTRMELLKEYQE